MLTSRPAAASAALQGSAGSQDDEVLLRRLRGGEGRALEAVVRAEGPRLLDVTRRLLRSEPEAQAAVQEAFLSALGSLDAVPGAVRFSTWLYRIAVGVALARLGSRPGRSEESIEHLLPAFVEGGHLATIPPAWRDGPDVRPVRGEDRAFVRACIDRLPDRHRTVLILRDVEELDAAETALILGLSQAEIRERLHRARQALRSLLEPRFQVAAPPAWALGGTALSAGAAQA